MAFILMAEVMRQDIEDPLAKWLLLCLADYSNEETKLCFPSISTIMKRSGMKKTTVHSRLNWLEEHGYINRTSGNSMASNIYTVLPNLVRQTNHVVHNTNTNLPSNLPKYNRKARRKSLTEDWKPEDELIIKLKERFEGLDHDIETDKFINHHLAKGNVFADAGRAYANWCRNAFNFRAKTISFEEFKRNKVSSRNGHSSSVYARLSDQFKDED